MTATVEARNVSKWFGQKVAVSEVSVSFGPGVTGVLGPNGAGKTTLLRVLTGLQVPSQGEVRLLGVDPRKDPSIYRRMALVPEDEEIYAHLSARRFVRLSAQLSRVKDPGAATEWALETVQLIADSDRHLDGFSKGMRQRAKVAAALVTQPDVLVLDEPLNGADPVQRARLIELFVTLGNTGTTVIVSSHVLAEVERMAERVIAMVDGRLAAEGDVHAIRAAMTDKPRRVRVGSDQPRRLAAGLIECQGVAGVTLGAEGLEIQASDLTTFALDLPRIAREAQVRLTSVEPVDESLESVFRYLVGKD